MIFLEIGKHAFKCPFCSCEYSELEGQYFSKFVSQKGEHNHKCKQCKQRFTITNNMKGNLVIYENPVIKVEDLKEYNKIRKRESRLRLKERKGI